MYQDLLQTNADDILDWKSYSDYLQLWNKWSLNGPILKSASKQKDLSLDLSLVALLRNKTSSYENVKSSQFLPKLNYETVYS